MYHSSPLFTIIRLLNNIHHYSPLFKAMHVFTILHRKMKMLRLERGIGQNAPPRNRTRVSDSGGELKNVWCFWAQAIFQVLESHRRAIWAAREARCCRARVMWSWEWAMLQTPVWTCVIQSNKERKRKRIRDMQPYHSKLFTTHQHNHHYSSLLFATDRRKPEKQLFRVLLHGVFLNENTNEP